MKGHPEIQTESDSESLVGMASSLGKEALRSLVTMEVLAKRMRWELNWPGFEFCLRFTHRVTLGKLLSNCMIQCSCHKNEDIARSISGVCEDE
jgi:hypothetical protein